MYVRPLSSAQTGQVAPSAGVANALAPSVGVALGICIVGRAIGVTRAVSDVLFAVEISPGGHKWARNTGRRSVTP